MSNVVFLASRRSSAAPDLRADGGIRRVFLDPRCIKIERTVAGVQMRVVVPVEFYRGVVLSCEEAGEHDRYFVTLVHPDSELSVVLLDAKDPNWLDLLAIWQHWAEFFNCLALFPEDMAETKTPAEADVPVFSLQWREGCVIGTPEGGELVF